MPLTFGDWLATELDPRSEYVTISNWDADEQHGLSRAKYATFSALVTPTAIDRVLSDLSWEVHPDISRPSFYAEKNEIIFRLGGRTKVDGTVFHPFVHYRSYHDLAPTYCEVTDEFIDYHRLAPASGNWVQPLTGQTVVDRLAPTHLRVRRDALTDYLAARKLALVRFHDHLRWVCDPAVPVRSNRFLRANDVNLELVVDADRATFECRVGRCWVSILWGKDAIRPAAEPSHKDYLFEKDRLRPDPLPEYIVGDDGATMRPVDHYGDNDSPFLTPVYFNAEVLNRYFADSRAFDVDGYYIRDNSGYWGLEYGRSTSGAVIVWLGDLAQKLPSTEHKYWKPYNIAPSGRMREDFYKPQILGQWTDSQDAAVIVRNARESASRVVFERVGMSLFREPDSEQAHTLNTLHVPLSNDPRELAQQIGQLAMVCVDGLNVDLLVKVLPDRKFGVDSRGDRLPSISLLHAVLVHAFKIESTRADELTKPFRAVQDLRSKFGAHLTSSAAISGSLARAGVFPGTEGPRVFTVLAENLAAAISEIAGLITR